MKFLLVTSQNKEIVKVWVCQETSPTGSLLPPVDLASIASVIRLGGHEARICDLRLKHDPMKSYHEEILSFKPDAVIINITTTSAHYDYALLAKTPHGTTKISFGTHVQSLVDDSFDQGVDAILLGDPEATILNLASNNLNGDSVPGVLTKKARTKKPCYYKPIDSMPFPALDLLDMSAYHASYIKGNRKFTILLGSRGCNYKCTYCLYPVLFGNKARMRSVEKIVSEMKYDNERFGIKEFLFLDATFNSSKERVVLFCEEILRRGLNVKWLCNMRVSPVSKDLLELMKKAGCTWIFYGVEDQDFLVETRKGTTKSSTIKSFQLTREAKINSVAFTMLFPERKLDEKSYVRNTLKVLKTLNADAFQLNIAIPFPGTELYKNNSNGQRPEHENWLLFDPHGDKLPSWMDQNILNVRKSVYRNFVYRNPVKIFRLAMRMSGRAFFSTCKAFIKSNFIRLK